MRSQQHVGNNRALHQLRMLLFDTRIDVLLGAHVAPLEFAFYSGKQFPESYWGGAFIAEHGSWNRAARSGYQVAFVAFQDGKPSADPVPFLTGLVPDPSGSDVYGRPGGVAGGGRRGGRGRGGGAGGGGGGGGGRGGGMSVSQCG